MAWRARMRHSGPMARRHPSLVALSRDHHDALALAFRLHHPSPPGPATAVTPPSTPRGRAAAVLDFFRAHLAGHFAAEEEALFPAVAARLAPAAAEHALLGALIDDHRRMEALRDEIARALEARAPGEDDAQLAAALQALADLLERHVRREERELFARFVDLAGDGAHAELEQHIAAILARRPPAACALPGPAT